MMGGAVFSLKMLLVQLYPLPRLFNTAWSCSIWGVMFWLYSGSFSKINKGCSRYCGSFHYLSGCAWANAWATSVNLNR